MISLPVRCFLAWMTLALFCGCGCGGGGGGSNNNVGPALTAEQTRAAVEAVQTKLVAVQSLDIPTGNQQILDVIHSRPEFTASGIIDTSVWARFSDGRYYVVVNDHSQGRAANIRSAQPVVARGANQIPKSKKVRVIDSRHDTVPIVSNLQPILQKGGYDAVGENGTLENYRKQTSPELSSAIVSDAFGGRCDTDSGSLYALSTDTPVD